MKNVPALFAAAALIFAASSCDKHSWESTQGLHEGMHKAHGEHHDEAPHGEVKKDEHGKTDAHAPAAAAPHGGEAKH